MFSLSVVIFVASDKTSVEITFRRFVFISPTNYNIDHIPCFRFDGVGNADFVSFIADVGEQLVDLVFSPKIYRIRSLKGSGDFQDSSQDRGLGDFKHAGQTTDAYSFFN
jgi:hypothetical protein